MTGGFFAQAVTDAGAAISGYNKQRMTDQELQINQQQIESNKMAMLAQAQTADAKKQISTYLATQVKSDSSTLQNPVKTAEMYGKAATIAGANGEFDLMEHLAGLQKKSLDEYKEVVVTKAKEKAEAKSELADAAYEYTQGDMTNPLAMQHLAEKAMAAGVDPTTIPSIMKPVEVAAWAKSMSIESKEAIAREKFIDDANKKKTDAEYQRKEYELKVKTQQDNEQDKALRRGDQALHWAELKEGKESRKASATPKFVVEDDTKWEYAPDPKAFPGVERKGPPGTPGADYVKFGAAPLGTVTEGRITRTLQSGTEIARNLQKMNHFTDTSLSPFQGQAGDTLIGSLIRTGTKSAAPDLVNAYGATVGAIGNEYGNMFAAFGGRTAGDKAQAEFMHIVARESGDSAIVGAYKLANGAEMYRAYLKALPHAKTNPQVQEQLSMVADIPPSDAILAQMQDASDRKKAKKLQGAVSSHVRGTQETIEKGRTESAPGVPPGATIE